MSIAPRPVLLFLGDSLVEWGDWDSLLPEYTVVNRGRAGERVEELAARLPAELQAAPAVDRILIMSGTNNLLMEDLYFPQILKTMLPRIHDLCPGVPVTIHSMTPMRLDWLAEERIEAANHQLRQVARATSCHILDLVAPFTSHCEPVTRPCFLDDGIHLSSRGYTIWADAIRSHLVAA
ncbi:GDSL-type esterase/lipase family protein [Thermodesulfobacteriota bacterium B35]